MLDFLSYRTCKGCASAVLPHHRRQDQSSCSFTSLTTKPVTFAVPAQGRAYLITLAHALGLFASSIIKQYRKMKEYNITTSLSANNKSSYSFDLLRHKYWKKQSSHFYFIIPITTLLPTPWLHSTARLRSRTSLLP
jgi:hypothetical protein